jgi:hypothetical protein
MAYRRLTFKRLVSTRWHPDPGLLLALALALVAASPFLTRPGLPRGTDAELHVFRAAELGYSLQAGDLYPRWAPDFYYGYGYPIFNYYAPLTYYLSNLFDLWPGSDIVGSVKLVFILGLAGAAAGVYLFVRDWVGPRPGLLAAGLYVFSPYVFFVDPHMRGVLAESFSLGLFPLALWVYGRLLMDGRRRWLVLGAILQAALIMTHNLLAAVLTALLVAYVAWRGGWRLFQSWRQRGPRASLAPWWIPFGRAFLVMALGIGLSAIFWLPVLQERGDVHLTLTGPGHFDFHNHFLTLDELLAPSSTLDLGAAAPHFALNLGAAQWLLALLALPALIWGPPGQRRLTGFFVLCSVGLVVLMLPISAPIWEMVPGMALLQFPWRLLGPVGVALSMTAAAGFAFFAQLRFKGVGAMLQRRWSVMALAVGIGLTLWLALPAMFPPLWAAEFGPTDPSAIIEFELSGVAVGTTSTGDYLPIHVEVAPHPEPAFLATYGGPGGVDKVNRATLPAGTVVETVSHGPTHDRFHVVSNKPFILRLFTFYFPGWRATVDGQEVPIELGRPEGFITIEVPSGTHTVEVRLGAWATPARLIGTLASLLSLAALGLVGWWGGALASPRRALPPQDRAKRIALQGSVSGRTLWGSPLVQQREAGEGGGPLRLDRPAWLSASGVVLIFLIFKVGLVDRRHDWFRYTSPPGQVRKVGYSLADRPIDFGHHIQLLGYDLPQSQVGAGGTLPLTLYWRATEPVPDNYQVFAHLTRPATHLWGQSDKLNPGDFPTQRWPLDKYVRDEHELDILPGTPPGDYQLTVGLYTLLDGIRVPVFDADGQLLGNTLTLPTPVRVTRPRRSPSEDVLGLTDVVGADYAGQITLLGAVLPDRQIELPGFIHLALVWRALVDEPNELTVRFQLVDAEGRVAQEIVTPPVDGQYPSSFWSAGEVVRDQYSLWLAEDYVPGAYELRIGLHLQGHDDWVSLGRLEVLGP